MQKVQATEIVQFACQSRNTLIVLKIFSSSKKCRYKRLEFDSEKQVQKLQDSIQSNSSRSDDRYTLHSLRRTQ